MPVNPWPSTPLVFGVETRTVSQALHEIIGVAQIVPLGDACHAIAQEVIARGLECEDHGMDVPRDPPPDLPFDEHKQCVSNAWSECFAKPPTPDLPTWERIRDQLDHTGIPTIHPTPRSITASKP